MSIEYYKKVKELQRLQHENEQERMELDQQLNSYLKSGKQFNRLKAAKLQTYWQKICDDERKSRARNEQLLKEFQRVQTHMDALSARTERLRMLKEQYELQVERMYPRWKERLELKQQQRQQANTRMDENEYQHLNRLRLQSTSLDSGPPLHRQNPTVHLHVPQDTPAPQSFTSNVPREKSPVDSYRERDYGQRVPPEDPVRISTGYLQHQELTKSAISTTKVPEQESKDDDYDYPYHDTNDYEVAQSPMTEPVKTPNGTKEVHSASLHHQKIPADIPFTTVLTYGSGTQVTKSDASVPVRNNSNSIEGHGRGLSTDSESDYRPLDRKKSGDQPSNARRSDSLDSGKNYVSRQHSTPSLSRQQPIESGVQENSPGRKDEPVVVESASTPFTSDNDESDKSIQYESHDNGVIIQPKMDEIKQETASLKEMSDLEIESGSEIGSETSLPLSDNDSKTIPAQVTKHTISAEMQDPSVTTDGLWHMIRAIELEIEESDEVNMIYNAPNGTSAIVAEIVKEANSKKHLQHLNPNTVSMVVLKELPLILRKSSGGCLISDKILTSTMPCSEVTIRSYMYSASLAIWDRLLQHFVTLLQKDVFTIEEIASKFAPLMIKAESVATYKTKAIKIMKDVLAVIPLNETLNETVSSMGATPQNNRTSTRQDDRGASQVPRLDLEGMKSDTEESEYSESSSDHNVPLNETEAYQQMMRQLHQPANDDVSEDEVSGLEGDEESDDTLDNRPSKAAQPSPRLTTPPSSSRSNKGKRNVLSSLGGMGSLGISYENDNDGPMSARSQIDTGRSGHSDAISSLDPTPRESAYVPSGMDQSLKSTGRSDKRSAAFWGNESDIESESEMTVPMGTGTIPAGTGTMKSDVEFEEDDFDFYD